MVECASLCPVVWFRLRLVSVTAQIVPLTLLWGSCVGYTYDQQRDNCVTSWYLASTCSIISFSCISKCLLSSQVFQNVMFNVILETIFHFENLLILTSNVKLAMLKISGCDIFRSLAPWFRPFASSVCDTKYHKWCTLFMVFSFIYYSKLHNALTICWECNF